MSDRRIASQKCHSAEHDIFEIGRYDRPACRHVFERFGRIDEIRRFVFAKGILQMSYAFA